MERAQKYHCNDPLELAIDKFLTDSSIRYTRPDKEPSSTNTLDFHLTDFNVSIEVKAWSCERIHEQITHSEADGRTILLIGMPAVKAFIALCSGRL